uniref:Deoxynucleoside kinase domain-containing protein n=1 Tax=viral metagenome TaxID=1070528 RepID=A0A6C0I7E4_9ZZZZ
MALNEYITIVSIEGNIGSGKSTLLETLKTIFKENANVLFLREPVDEWEKIKDKDGNTMLQKFYANQQQYSFAFQMMAYISRLTILRETVRDIMKRIQTNNNINKKEKYIIITERSLYTDKFVFAKMLYDQGKIEDVKYQIYLNWFDEFAKDFPVNDVIYVNTDPTKCYERIHKRARIGEEVIPLAYLTACHDYHNSFLDETTGIKATQLVLDGNLDIFQNSQVVNDWIVSIKEFLQIE